MTATMTRGSLACPPRFGTPRTSRPTLGGQAAVIAARLRRPLTPWQRHVVDVALEVNTDGSLAYSEVNLIVPRQEGKTELKFVVMVMRLTAMVLSHGPQRVTYTMQDRKKARTRLERDYAARLRNAVGFKEILPTSRVRPTKRTEWRLGMNSGVESIQFGSDSWLQIDTPSRTGLHGDTLDLGMIDEAFAHQDDTVEQGMEPAMLTRRDAQLWVLSAAGDAKAIYLYRKVLRGRRTVEAGDSGLAYFEWSAEDDDDPGDPGTWRRCCPALGITFPNGGGITEAKMQALWRKAKEGGPDAIDGFRRAYLAQWPEVPILAEDAPDDGPLPGWSACVDHLSQVARPLALALDVSFERTHSTFAVASASSLGGTHLEVTHRLPGTAETVAKAKELQDRFGGVLALAVGSPAASLVPSLLEAGVRLLEVKPRDHARACGALYDAVEQRRVRHLAQPELAAAVKGAGKRDSDDAWLWSRKNSAVDISPLVAVTLAKWALEQAATPTSDFFMV